METVLSNDSIAEYLTNHQRRRAFLRFCHIDLLRAIVNESKTVIDAKEEEELARMQREEEKQKAIAEATDRLRELGVTPQELQQAFVPPAAKGGVKKTGYRRPDNGKVVYWSHRGRPPKDLEDLVAQYGKDGIKQFAVSES